MGQTTTATVEEVEQTRRRLDAELEELERYLPPTTAKVKRVGMIAGGIWGGVMLMALVLRRRRQHRETRLLREIDHRLARMEDRLA